MIARDISGATSTSHDLLVIGGGIHGVCLFWEAARRGLRACLCEARDFGSGTSWNSLRILHGGLRYLQTGNLPRFRQSVRARAQWGLTFPQLVEPLRCFLPLDGQGLRRPIVLKAALAANDALTGLVTMDLQEAWPMTRGRVISPDREDDFPRELLTRAGLGVASWYDCLMRSPERIVMELVRDGCRHGSMALNYCRVDRILLQQARVEGVVIHDNVQGGTHALRASAVVDCTGPASGLLGLQKKSPAHPPVLAANLLLDIPMEAGKAVGAYAPQKGGQTLFFVPCHGVMMAGTGYFSRPDGCLDAALTDEETSLLQRQFDAALPGLGIRNARVLQRYSGLLPASNVAGIVSMEREQILNHGELGGAKGLFSVTGVKYTTANVLAESLIDRLFPDSSGSPYTSVPLAADTHYLIDPGAPGRLSAADLSQVIARLLREESVVSVEDLIRRRTAWSHSDRATLESILRPVFQSLPREVTA